MRPHFFIFFTIFFAVYGLVNLYIFVRGWQALSNPSLLRAFYIPLFLVLSLSFIGGRVLENYWLSGVSDVLIWIGSFWVAAMLYFLLTLFVLDLARLINHWIPFFPSFVVSNDPEVKRWAALFVIILTTLILLAGHINALNPRIKTLDLTIPKKNGRQETLNMVVASDIHLGTIIGRKRFDRIVARINELNPDMILLPGDMVDEDLAPVINQNLGESLKNLKSKFGVFAVTGNHEYIGGVEKAYRYLADHGVQVLRDQAVRVNNSIYLVGREDRSIDQFTGKRRRPLSELLAHVDKEYPVILMDHQPFHLEEGENNGVDLQLSGHTHHGQLWPGNLISEKVYELSWGYKRKTGTQVYVSCGVGTWGPPVRLGNRPEIVNILLRFATPPR